MKNLFLILLAVITFSCGRPYKVEKVTDAPQEKEKILLLDHGLLYYLNVVKQAQTKLDGGQMQIKIEIENEEDKDVWCDVQVRFLGTDGFEVEKIDWQPILFHRRTLTTIQKSSLNPNVADYRVSIRNAK